MMKACLYGELSPMLKGSGIGTAIDQQKKALALNGVEVTRSLDDRFDIIDINTILPYSAYVANLMRWKGVPIVMHTHTTVEDIKDSFKYSKKLAPKLRGYLRYFYGQADLLVSPSEYTRDVLRGYGLKREIRVISNGVDTERFKPNARLRREYRERYGLEGIVPYCVGHVFKRKGVFDFIELAERFPDNKFMWVGRIYRDLVDSEVKNIVKKRPGNVMFTGYVKDVIGAYCAGDIFLFPSYCENQGISILEAAACRKPLIVRDLPTYTGWLEHGRNCLKAKNNQEFAKYIRMLKDDSRLRKRLADNAYRMSKQHTLKKIGRQLKQAYESIV